MKRIISFIAIAITLIILSGCAGVPYGGYNYGYQNYGYRPNYGYQNYGYRPNYGYRNFGYGRDFHRGGNRR